jgi:hypothetical protein
MCPVKRTLLLIVGTFLTVAGCATETPVTLQIQEPTTTSSLPPDCIDEAEGRVCSIRMPIADSPSVDDNGPGLSAEEESANTPIGIIEGPVDDQPMSLEDRLAEMNGSTTVATTTIVPTSIPSTTTSSTLPPTTAPACVFTGFFSPVDNTPVVNLVKAASAVPVKFGFCQSGSLSIFTSGSPSSAVHPCGTIETDEIESTVAVSTSGLTFDTVSGRYQYNWKTDKTWVGQCRTLTLRFTNGTVSTAEFKFR